VCLLAGTFSAAQVAAQIPEKFTNLQVLPKDIARGPLVATMRGMAGGLGVRCTHCHQGPDDLTGMDFATDAKETKRAARVMLQMVLAMNRDFLKQLPAKADGRAEITCATCHRSQPTPPRRLEDVLADAHAKGGVAAVVAEYHSYRDRFLEAGLYNFSERTLNVLGTRLGDAGKGEDAVAVFQANVELFPRSAGPLAALAQALLARGDRAGAEAAARKAVALQPEDPRAQSVLKEVLEKDAKP
jgi:tetratricopeptide (TPR) repeat protein